MDFWAEITADDEEGIDYWHVCRIVKFLASQSSSKQDITKFMCLVG